MHTMKCERCAVQVGMTSTLFTGFRVHVPSAERRELLRLCIGEQNRHGKVPQLHLCNVQEIIDLAPAFFAATGSGGHSPAVTAQS